MRPDRRGALVGLAAAILAASLIEGGWALGGGWPLRLAALGLWAGVTAFLWGARPLTPLATPSYLLPSLALFLYSLIPALYVFAALGGPIAILPDDPPSLARTIQPLAIEPQTARRAVQSAAELMILRFAVLGLAVASLLGGPRAPDLRPELPRPAIVAATAVGGVVAALIFAAAVATTTDSPGSRWAAEARTVMPALYLLALGQLLLWLAVARRRVAVVALLAVLAAAPLLAHGAVKVVTLGIAALTLVLLFSPAIPGRWRAAAGIAAVLLAVSGQAALMAQRMHIWDHPDPVGALVSWLPGKYVYRQSETVYCLANVLREDAAGPGKSLSQLGSLAAALVPRTLWPGKPSLSNGGDYALRYCGREISITSHSSSISLVGEPLMFAGPAGAWITLATLLALLAGLSRHAVRLGPATPAVLAITPWLIDFDQPATLYLAIAGKTGLAAGAAMLALAWAARRGRDPDPSAGSAACR